MIILTAFFAAILTFFSGFGLGTILTPVFMIFLPVELAIASTGVVHFFNNIFKLVLVGKHANKQLLIYFGIPAVFAAALGALVLTYLPKSTPLFLLHVLGKHLEIYPVKFMVGILLIVFACMDLIPYFAKLQFEKKWLPLGGILSGFFGGLSGNQGALRTAFLIKSGLSKEAFVATAAVASTFVDITRLGIYSTAFSNSGINKHWQFIICAIMAATTGSFLGNKLIKKTTLHLMRIITATLLIILSFALILGIV